MIKIIIPDYCNKILKTLKSSGYEGFLVGGCVRDSLMGVTPDDYDITTNATPQEMIEVFKDFKVFQTGLSHGTVTVVVDNVNVEVTTYRIDGEYTDNRHPKEVLFTRNIAEDLSRRDFTINAMAYNEQTGLIDLFGGVDDLNKRAIKTVGDPDKRFSEDGLRILRALRFASKLGFEIEECTAKSIIENKHLLQNISKERIFVEFKKLLCGKNVENVLLQFKDVVAEFVPEIKPCFDFNQNTKYHCYDVYTHIVKTVSAIQPDVNLRLAAFFHDIGKPSVYFTDEKGVGHFYGHNKVSSKMTKEILARLKSDNDTKKKVSTLVYIHDREIALTEKSVKRFLSRYSVELFNDLLKIKVADASAHAKEYRNRDEYIKSLEKILEKISLEDQCFSLKDLKLNGRDLIELGFSPSKEIGDILKKLLSAVIDGRVENEKSKLIDYLRKLK